MIFIRFIHQLHWLFRFILALVCVCARVCAISSSTDSSSTRYLSESLPRSIYHTHHTLPIYLATPPPPSPSPSRASQRSSSIVRSRSAAYHAPVRFSSRHIETSNTTCECLFVCLFVCVREPPDHLQPPTFLLVRQRTIATTTAINNDGE